MSAALQEVLATIDQEIAKLQTARAVVAGLVGQSPTSKPVAPSSPAGGFVVIDGPPLLPEQPAVSSQQPPEAPRPLKPRVIRAPAMPTLSDRRKVELSPEQISIIRAGALADPPRPISHIAADTGLSDYIVKTRIATMQMEGQL